jgi:hypothetical protein
MKRMVYSIRALIVLQIKEGVMTMKRKKILVLLLLVVLCVSAMLLFSGDLLAASTTLKPAAPQAPVGTAFTYQGYLAQNGTPVDGDDQCDGQFGLWDAAALGSQLGATQTVTLIDFDEGYFTVALNGSDEFGATPFDGETRWLAIALRCPAGTGAYTSMGRQVLVAAPYAHHSLSSWNLTGNAGTTPGTNFLGTTDNQALELHVNGSRALRLEPDSTSPRVIGGYSGNNASGSGATISGGGVSGSVNSATADYATVGGGLSNTAWSDYATVGGGSNNSAGNNATVGGGSNNSAGYNAAVGGGSSNTAYSNFAIVGGGQSNSAAGEYTTVGGGQSNSASGEYATIGGGYDNVANYSGDYATVGGGQSNSAGGQYATIGGGYDNVIDSNSATIGGGQSNSASDNATVGGGSNNSASDNATVGGGSSNKADSDYATVGGGQSNSAGGQYATVGGGYDNVANSNSNYATVGGGYSNSASGQYATIGGGYDNAIYNYDYATVGGGSSNTAGGQYATVGGGSNNSAGYYATVAGGSSNSAYGPYSFAAGYQANANHNGTFVWSDSSSSHTSTRSDQFYVGADGGAYFDVNSDHWVEIYVQSGNLISTSTGAHLTTGGAWTDVSDRDAKENFAPVDGQEVLGSLVEMPITTWNFKAEEPSIRHLGPTAQDFYAAFGLGADDRHIASLDSSGVALAAVQGLYARLQALEVENDSLKQQLEDQETRLAALEEAVGSATLPQPLQSRFLPGASALLASLGLVWVFSSKGASDERG